MNRFCRRCSEASGRRLLILGATLVSLGASSAALADPLTIQSSTTFNRRIMEPYQAEIETISGQQLKSTPGLIALLEGQWVLRTACAQAAAWSKPVSVAVNLSPAQFKSQNLVQL